MALELLIDADECWRQAAPRTLRPNWGLIFDAPDAPPELRRFRNSAYANAYLALGMLAYGGDHMRQSSAYLAKAAQADPSFATDARLVSRYVKSFAGRRVLDTLRQWRPQPR